MAEAVSITAQARDAQKNKGTGTRFARRMRAQGRIPAIIYGHKQAPQPISLSRDDVQAILKRSVHLAQLAIDGASETVLVRDIQWDHLGKEVIHLDFARVRADERIKTHVTLILHGNPIGLSEGGAVEQPVHTVTITCPANAIPDALRIEIGELHVGQGVHVRELALPEGVAVEDDPDLLLVHVINRVVAAEPTPSSTEAGAPAQPEVIGRKAEEKEE